MTERRYNDDEVAAIFAKAAEGPRPLPLQSQQTDGLTLAELQQIGGEAGMSPAAVARAARELEVRPFARSRRFLGLPIGVERTITLNRWLSDAEWERVVVQLREVFDARGTMSGHGSFRQWTNGNLQALLEPTETGHRLRLRTTRGSAQAGFAVGSTMLGVSGALAAATAAGGHLAAASTGVVMLALIGAGMIANSALRLPGWAKLRGRQMDEISTGLALEAGERPVDERK
jgi:hypothetical protein